MRLKRRKLAWLGTLGSMLLVAVLAGAPPAVAVTLLGIYGAAAAGTLVEFKPERLIDRSRSSLTQMRMSTDAREAVERARRRGGMAADGLTLLDIGLISAQSSREGVTMRRTRSVSLDDDGVRPFITLHVQPEHADQTSRFRFEILDGSGVPQYVHEMRTFLRDGEMNILADHQLPLAENVALQSGDWDMRVFIDGKLVGAHMFTLAPSLNDRFRRFEQRSASRQSGERISTRDRAQDEDDSALSLEELLRSRSNRNG